MEMIDRCYKCEKEFNYSLLGNVHRVGFGSESNNVSLCFDCLADCIRGLVDMIKREENGSEDV